MSDEVPAEGPHITEDHVNEMIVATRYHRFPGTTMTVCCMTLKNGFNVIGENACADPANFSDVVGEHFARKNAREKIWVLEGYLLRQRLHDGEITGGVPEGDVDALIEDLAGNE